MPPKLVDIEGADIAQWMMVNSDMIDLKLILKNNSILSKVKNIKLMQIDDLRFVNLISCYIHELGYRCTTVRVNTRFKIGQSAEPIEIARRRL